MQESLSQLKGDGNIKLLKSINKNFRVHLKSFLRSLIDLRCDRLSVDGLISRSAYGSHTQKLLFRLDFNGTYYSSMTMVRQLSWNTAPNREEDGGSN